MEKFTLDTLGRKVATIRPDGTWWIAPDVMSDEIVKAFPFLVQEAARLYHEVHELKKALGVRAS